MSTSKEHQKGINKAHKAKMKGMNTLSERISTKPLQMDIAKKGLSQRLVFYKYKLNRTQNIT